MQTTIGNLLINEALPEDLRDYNRVWNKKTARDVIRQVAQKYPDRMPTILQHLMRVGQSAATSGDFSMSISDFVPSSTKRGGVAQLKIQVRQIEDDPLMSPEEKNKKVVSLLGKNLDKLSKSIMDEGVKSGSRFADIVASGSKGSLGQYNTTVGAPLLFMDHKDRPIPVPVFNSVSEGFDPVEYWASSYGTRKGVIATKFATADAGYFGKKLGLAAQRMVITEDDCGTNNGLPVAGDDAENIGTVLQNSVGGIQSGTILKSEHIKRLKGKDIVVRSPVTCQAESGLCSRCAGVREKGRFPDIGENIGITAASTLSERLSQGMLNVKHTAGAATGKDKQYTFEDVDRLFEMPKTNIKAAPVAEATGTVQKIEDSPTGGVYVTIDGQEHWVATRDALKVKVGDRVEAGDVLAIGIANPSLIAKYRGIGDARREFVNQLREVTNDKVSRRNSEVLARAVVSHVRAMGPQGTNGIMAGDILRYDNMVRGYEPRDDSVDTLVTKAKGGYLEQPVLHHTIGTKVNDRVLRDLKKHGVRSILVNKEAPDFEPDVQRTYNHTLLDPDWMTRLGGYNVKTTFLESVHRGLGSEEQSTSYVPALAKGINFGENVKTEGKY